MFWRDIAHAAHPATALTAVTQDSVSVFLSGGGRLVNQHHASILNRITDKGGPGWTILAMMVMRGWPVGFAGAGLAVARAIGWL